MSSPLLAQPVPVVAAKNVAYIANANRFQNLNLYLPATPEMAALVDILAQSVPPPNFQSSFPRCHVHVHGGAWRDPRLTAASVEPTVAHAFSAIDKARPITVFASINYTISQFPTHPTSPYDAIKDNHTDPAREAVHPQHVSDVLHAFALLRSFGLTDRSYLLSGHSCGACLAFQAILQSPGRYGLEYLPDAPCPAAILGLNGLYDLPTLVDGLGASHAHLRDDYEMFLSNAFGKDKTRWPAASPARFDPAEIAGRVQAGKAPRLVVLDHSTEDQLVPMNQRERFEATLGAAGELRVVRGHRCTDEHAAPWEGGRMIWDGIQDALKLLHEEWRSQANAARLGERRDRVQSS